MACKEPVLRSSALKLCRWAPGRQSMAYASETPRLQQCDALQLHAAHDLLLTARGAESRKANLASKDTRNPFFQNQEGLVFLNAARMPRRRDECLKSSKDPRISSRQAKVKSQTTTKHRRIRKALVSISSLQTALDLTSSTPTNRTLQACPRRAAVLLSRDRAVEERRDRAVEERTPDI